MKIQWRLHCIKISSIYRWNKSYTLLHEITFFPFIHLNYGASTPRYFSVYFYQYICGITYFYLYWKKSYILWYKAKRDGTVWLTPWKITQCAKFHNILLLVTSFVHKVSSQSVIRPDDDTVRMKPITNKRILSKLANWKDNHSFTGQKSEENII
jgi:hypothetical protein